MDNGLKLVGTDLVLKDSPSTTNESPKQRSRRAILSVVLCVFGLVCLSYLWAPR